MTKSGWPKERRGPGWDRCHSFTVLSTLADSRNPAQLQDTSNMSSVWPGGVGQDERGASGDREGV